MTDGNFSIAKLFADDTSLFSVVQNKNNSASQLNNDLNKVSDWAYTWKMPFNADPSKQAQEVIFSRKYTKESHPPIYFNDIPVNQTTVQKHIGMYLDEKLNYNTHIKEKLSKVYKGIGLLRNLSNKLPRQALVTIYKAFIRPHLDYGDIVYDNPDNEILINKIEKAQYDAALAITGTIRGTSLEKLYAELGIESLKFRRWFRKLACFYKIQSKGLSKYLPQLIPTNNRSYTLRKPLNILHYYCRTDTFKNSFFPNVINEWNKLDEKIKGATSFSLFTASLLKIGRPYANSTYTIHNPDGKSLLRRLRLGLSHLNEHKFRHNFADCVNPLCSCCIEPETTLHVFLHCHNFLNIRRKLFDKIKLLDETLLQLNDESLLTVLLFGSKIYNEQVNVQILNASIDYIINSDRFTGYLI